MDITWMRQGYHNYPDQLKSWLQKEIDAIEAGRDHHTAARREEDGQTGVPDDFDAITLGYGLCSNAVAGLSAGRHRLVIPRAHDCITLGLIVGVLFLCFSRPFFHHSGGQGSRRDGLHV